MMHFDYFGPGTMKIIFGAVNIFGGMEVATLEKALARHYPEKAMPCQSIVHPETVKCKKAITCKTTSTKSVISQHQYIFTRTFIIGP